MDKRKKGAWIIYQTKKLSTVTNYPNFEEIDLAGKCGLLLSGVTESENESQINWEKLNAIAQASNIKRIELPAIISRLKDKQLIDEDNNGNIISLGLTTSSILKHISDIHEQTPHNSYQDALIDLSENVSEIPRMEERAKEYISDTYKLDQASTKDFFYQIEEMELIDSEKIDDTHGKLYFNGNLFRNSDPQKTLHILQSLDAGEQQSLREIDNIIEDNGCIPYEKALKIAGEQLLSKINSIGLYDFNELSNENESKVFITRPSSFSKYGNPFEDDALDLAKAFVTALYYGMNYRSSNKGRIYNLEALLRKLLHGKYVGPATAIGKDYKILELKRVIELKPASGGRYFMRLLKQEVGEIALNVLQQGESSEQVIKHFDSQNISNYLGPETLRQVQRKKQKKASKKETMELLRTFRNE